MRSILSKVGDQDTAFSSKSELFKENVVLTLFRMGIFWAVYGWVDKKNPSLKSVSHILQWWKLEQLYLILKRFEKHMNHVTHTLNSAEISIFLGEISNFCDAMKYRYRWNFNGWFLILSTLMVAFINLVAILMISVKLAILGLLKIKTFWNKGYSAIISVHEVTKKILWPDRNYIVNMVIWPKFVNSSISMKEVITT